MITINMSGANLIGADLSGANLRGANLSGADLRDTCRRPTDLSIPGWIVTDGRLVRS